MTEGPWLVDKSAIARIPASDTAQTWFERIDRGLLRITTPTLLELGFSARSRADWRTIINTPPIVSMPVEYLTPRAERRAVEVQEQMAGRGQHRAPSIPDLLVAAVAETAGLIVLHLHKDFELIAEVTGQPVERLTLV